MSCRDQNLGIDPPSGLNTRIYWKTQVSRRKFKSGPAVGDGGPQDRGVSQGQEVENPY